MWGIIPAAGSGSRIQPLAFSKELLPVGSQAWENVLRPRAVSEYLIERMVAAGVDKICFVISSTKSDIMRYFGYGTGNLTFCYTVQPKPSGLCDAVFRPLPFIGDDENIIIGLPDTIWFPELALCELPDGGCSLLLFPVDRPEYYDAVRMDENGRVLEVYVKQMQTVSNLIWGAIKMPGKIMRRLYSLWSSPGNGDEYIGTLLNKLIAGGETVRGIRAGSVYVDVGTVNGYYKAVQLLNSKTSPGSSSLEFVHEHR
ncbi:MAG: sugar phosphate nucleotidyltransferase [Chitinispirillaceae bacterium]